MVVNFLSIEPYSTIDISWTADHQIWLGNQRSENVVRANWSLFPRLSLPSPPPPPLWVTWWSSKLMDAINGKKVLWGCTQVARKKARVRWSNHVWGLAPLQILSNDYEQGVPLSSTTKQVFVCFYRFLFIDWSSQVCNS